jgi:hypothetical protein
MDFLSCYLRARRHKFPLMQLKFALVVVIALAGCKSSPEKTVARKSDRKITIQTNEVANPAPSKAVSRDLDALNGRILTVRQSLRFVIVDFPDQRLPKLDQKLSVYHQGQKVAEIKVSGPYRETTVVADILAGEPLFGDFVRNEP